ncbi:hypothetical protein GCM10010405_50750 [Streptomyces macrosporus]|uniref:Uncharacterized protein n=1 Tax=Streptomyces macrosporus TaxID=44032 RepID=A0ABP5XR33_9ACTN
MSEGCRWSLAAGAASSAAADSSRSRWPRAGSTPPDRYGHRSRPYRGQHGGEFVFAQRWRSENRACAESDQGEYEDDELGLVGKLYEHVLAGVRSAARQPGGAA